ncbi:MAG: hypothetical protein SOW50_03770 [Lachnospiraceae bacterium]|nr:hypothetical protein [Clostridiales bacterium]MDY3109219.1 hypothetical protein [Lachnospiraceae bacterium]
MANIVLDGSKIKVYGMLQNLCDYCNEKDSWCDELWGYMLQNDELYEEFVYFIVNRSLMGKMNVEGYTLIDLYVKQIDMYNVRNDLGKNPIFCMKEDMVLRSFLMMGRLLEAPETYKKKLEDGFGMDQL